MAGPTDWVARFYFQQGDQGWSENYYFKNLDLIPAQTAMKDMEEARMPLFTDQVSMTGASLIDLNGPRTSYPLDDLFPTLPLKGDYVPTTGGIEPADVCLLIKEFTDSGRFGTRHLHGIPDECVADPGVYSPVNAWELLLSAFITQYTSSCSLAKKTAGPPTTYALTPITSANAERLSNRRVGRPFGLARGRAIVA